MNAKLRKKIYFQSQLTMMAKYGGFEYKQYLKVNLDYNGGMLK